MIESKHLKKLTIVLVCVCIIISGLAVYPADNTDTINTPEYQKKLFGDEIISLDIQVDENEWRNLIANAQSKEWIAGDLVINGELFRTVGIRTKGNSSILQGIRADEARYSLQFKLNKYIKGRTYYGLDAFCVNNMMGDASYMKDYLSYEIMSYIGVATPLANYASVTVNGKDYGFCLALERLDKAFLDRVYGTSAGMMYNVKIEMGRRGEFENMWQDNENSDINIQQIQGNTVGEPSTAGGSLVYTGDDPADYSTIFDNSVIGMASANDQRRIITAIKNLNAGTDLEEYFDIDGILRYFAAHTVVVNLDSYISSMAQNYYIYERNGKISILPWDYGFAFGGFHTESASSVVNFAIDTPVSGVSMQDRPLLNVLLEVDEYRERYHQYLEQITEGYLESGLFTQTIDDLDARICEYVRNDITAFYTYEQYQAAFPVLKELGCLRAESIKGQLNGTIPSTSDGQKADNSTLIDASGVDYSAIGSKMGGGGTVQDGIMEWQRSLSDGGQQPEGQENSTQGGGPGMPIDLAELGFMPQAVQIIAEARGNIGNDEIYSLMELGLTGEQIEIYINVLNGLQSGIRPSVIPDLQGGGAIPGGNAPPGGQMGPPNNGADNWQVANIQNIIDTSGAVEQSSYSTEYIVLVVALLVILISVTVLIAKPRKNAI